MHNMSEASDHDTLYIPGTSGPVNREFADTPATTTDNTWSQVPWRTIIGAVGVVVATYVLIVVLLAATRIVMWVAIAGFMAIVLAPLVRRLDHRLGDRRTLATGLVVFATLLTMGGVVALFVMPVKTQLVDIITD
ncbi:MAG: hypothetical protein M3P52_06910, partial [Actinomycetota bacterium]|nr:hypothetical protein [Actinomycetota bacterium]